MELKGIKKVYKKRNSEIEILHNINLTLPKTGFICILGASGSGKSTLLNIIGGLLKPTSGEVIVDGKNISAFKEKDYDYYRNHYIGFVFQDYNLIEDYTVYENINIALELQQKKGKEEIEELLKKLGISKLKRRKASELSGGEKQRVAIARALIKKPKIVLADEPTGNLDSKTGIEIMNLLKEMSKTTLVIMVTHNQEQAATYADRIIEIRDGQVIDDAYLDKEEQEEKGNYEIVRSKLPLFFTFKLGFKSILKYKFKFLLSFFLMTITSLFLMTIYCIEHYDIDTSHKKVLEQNEISQIRIKKAVYGKNHQVAFLPLKQEDIQNITSKLSDNTFLVYEYEEDGENYLGDFLGLDVYISKDLFEEVDEAPQKLYFDYRLTPSIIVDYKFSKEKLIGRKPTLQNEIVISSYIADHIIEYGIKDKKTNIVFHPKNYEEIISADKTYKFGSYNECRIVGIVNYDLNEYETLKNYYERQNNLSNSIRNLAFKMRTERENLYNQIYISSSFIKALKLPQKTEIDRTTNTFKLDFGQKEKKAVSIEYPHDEMEYYDGSKWVKTKNLEENEVILSIYSLLGNKEEDYTQKKYEYQEKNIGKNSDELDKQFFLSYLSTTDILNDIGKKINLEIYENQLPFLDFQKEVEPSKKYSNIKVIGFTHQYPNYFSKKIVENYQKQYLSIEAVQKNSLKEDLTSLFSKFPYQGEYIVFSENFKDLQSAFEVIMHSKRIIYMTEIVFLLFSLLLIFNIMMNSVVSRQKDIGILKAMGSKSSDIAKIFLAEGFMIAIVTWFFSITLSFFFFPILQNYFGVENLFIFYLQFHLCIYIFIFLILSIFLSSLFPLLKMVKMNVVDIIYKR